MEDWPIYKASKNRNEIKERVIKDAFENLKEAYDSRTSVREILEKTIYSEKYRVKK